MYEILKPNHRLRGLTHTMQKYAFNCFPEDLCPSVNAFLSNYTFSRFSDPIRIHPGMKPITSEQIYEMTHISFAVWAS